MRIVHLATSLAGGAGIGLWRYHAALRQAGVDSRLLVMHPPARPPAELATVHWRKRALPVRLAQRLGLYRTRQERLQAEVAALDQLHGGYELFTLPYSDYCPEDHPWINEASVINLHWVAGMLDWPRFLGRVRQPLVITMHDQQPYLGGFHYDQDVTDHPRFAALESRLRAVKQTALAGHRVSVLANSRWNARAATASGFFPTSTPVETIYYPLDPAVYAPRPALAAKLALGLDPTRLTVGFACENLNNRRKGLVDLIEALALLPAALRARVALLSFGRDPAPDLRTRVDLPWQHLGYVETDAAKAAAYAAMDLFVAPSRAEAFGLTAIEAQAMGIPVVATPVGGLLEAVPSAREDYGDGPPGPNRLGDALARLLGDPGLRASRAATGRQAVIARHDPVAIGHQLADFHRRACA